MRSKPGHGAPISVALIFGTLVGAVAIAWILDEWLFVSFMVLTLGSAELLRARRRRLSAEWDDHLQMKQPPRDEGDDRS